MQAFVNRYLYSVPIHSAEQLKTALERIFKKLDSPERKFFKDIRKNLKKLGFTDAWEFVADVWRAIELEKDEDMKVTS